MTDPTSPRPSGQPNPAEIYDSFFVPSLFVPSTAELLACARPAPGERMLDVACGTGIVARTAASIVGDANVVGVDLAPPMLAVARAKSPSIEWRQGNAVALDLPDRSFDLVTCQHGIQFFPDRPAAARELRRVVKDTGRVVVAAWLPLDRHPFIQRLFETISRCAGLPVAALSVPFSIGAGELRAVLEGAGFGTVELAERTLRVRYASAATYLRLSTLGAAAVLPQLAANDLEALAANVEAEAAELLTPHRDGDGLAFDQHMNVAIARA